MLARHHLGGLIFNVTHRQVFRKAEGDVKMQTKKINLLIICSIVLCIVLFSCTSSDDLTDSTEHTRITLEIVPASNIPTIFDSTIIYRRQYVEWNTQTSLLDTSKADSLADWFAKSTYPVTDMWFPNTHTVCSYPIQTENNVVVKLEVAYTNIRSQGYKSTILSVNGCWHFYRHYTFTHIKDGP